jgi:hypothetical protein
MQLSEGAQDYTKRRRKLFLATRRGRPVAALMPIGATAR